MSEGDVVQALGLKLVEPLYLLSTSEFGTSALDSVLQFLYRSPVPACALSRILPACHFSVHTHWTKKEASRSKIAPSKNTPSSDARSP